MRTELVRGLKARGTGPATGMSFTFTAPPESMPDANSCVARRAPSAAASFGHTTVGWASPVVEKRAEPQLAPAMAPLAPDE